MSLFLRRVILTIFILIFVLIPISASPTHAAVGYATIFSGEIVEDGDALYQRVDDAGCVTTAGTPVYQYAVYSFYVDADGTYTIEITDAFLVPAEDNDTYITLYETAFDPAAPLTNCVDADDDSGAGGLSLITRDLTGGTQYILVISTFDEFSTGTYEGQIGGAGNVTPGMLPTLGAPVTGGVGGLPQVVTWFRGYRDNRINWREAYSPVALYGADYGGGQLGLHVYNIGSGSPEAAFFVSPQMIAAVPDHPAQHTLIAQTPDGHIRVYRLTNGWFQVMAGPNAEGKTSIIVFDHLCIGFNCAVYALDEIDPQ